MFLHPYSTATGVIGLKVYYSFSSSMGHLEAITSYACLSWFKESIILYHEYHELQVESK